jgi:DNA-binding NarL/FixJ family response regulator
VTLMDLRLPDMSGTKALISIRAEFREARIIMLTGIEGDAAIQEALAAGARGYLPKSTPPHEIMEAIRDVHNGKMSVAKDMARNVAEHLTDESLSKREVEILRHVSDGVRNRDIEFGCSSPRRRSRLILNALWKSWEPAIAHRRSRLCT